MKIRTFFAFASTLFLLISAVGTVPAVAASGTTRTISLGATIAVGTGSFTGSNADLNQIEFPGQQSEADGSAGPNPPTIVDRSLSKHASNGVSVNSGKKAKSN